MRFPPIEPYDHGFLEVGDGHRLYWECCGNPHGKPAVVLHGGPGAGCSTGPRRSFDPSVYRVVLFDQRNCGRSLPSAFDPSTDLATNTTWHLVDDLERLREHLGIERWLLFGGSWGVALALAYAMRHRERITEMVLVSVCLARRWDIDWLYHGSSRFFPAQWQRFRDHRVGDLVRAYDAVLNGSGPLEERQRAADLWCEWENTVLSLEPGYRESFSEPHFRLAFARIVTHYFSRDSWLGSSELLDGASALGAIPAVIIHGLLDLSCPTDGAWALAQAWPGAELHLVRTGHLGGEEMMLPLLEAIRRFGENAPENNR